MNRVPRRRAAALLLLLTLLSAGCSPLLLSSATPAADANAEATSGEEAAVPENSAIATVVTRSLRVRTEPLESAEVVAGLNEGEQYPVLGISSDGLWVELAIDGAPGGRGWVTASFVSVEGPITDIAITQAPTTTVALSPTGVITGATVNATPAPGFALVRTQGARLRVRSQPTTESEIVGYVYNGESYRVIETSADGLWVRIAGASSTPTDNPNGGWVSAEFVIIG
jgi:uncharacterized protein YgiM (DUF1202 family)